MNIPSLIANYIARFLYEKDAYVVNWKDSRGQERSVHFIRVGNDDWIKRTPEHAIHKVKNAIWEGIKIPVLVHRQRFVQRPNSHLVCLSGLDPTSVIGGLSSRGPCWNARQLVARLKAGDHRHPVTGRYLSQSMMKKIYKLADTSRTTESFKVFKNTDSLRAYIQQTLTDKNITSVDRYDTSPGSYYGPWGKRIFQEHNIQRREPVRIADVLAYAKLNRRLRRVHAQTSV